MFDDALLSHLLVWAIGGLAALGGLLTVAAFWSMGRAAYRKD
ncbi:MAG TPA: hypothetical protein VNT50_12895 [Microbacterium sp.]|nr:hypothetical protein [Microbacterium sp.]HWI32374.1 hypothetical protein [Microbacterium sp.]